MNRPVAAEDLAFVRQKLVQQIPDAVWPRGKSVLLTGATGFFGKWLTQGWLAEEDARGSRNRLVIVSRDRSRALDDAPWLAHPQVEWIETDIRELRSKERYDLVVHGAAAASAALNADKPELMLETIVEGTRRVLDVAANGTERFLFVSSGAVYGPQPTELSHVPEEYRGGPDPLDARAAYGEAKRVAEFLCATEARRRGYACAVARCYAFVGPYLPLDTHFAAGNFLKNVLEGEDIRIGGDGTPYRSYMYASDLVVWLLTLLVRGEGVRAYNVGSAEGVSIRELAEACRTAGGAHNLVHVARTAPAGHRPERYVPSVERARKELGLEAWTGLHSALEKTLKWHRAGK